MELMTPILFIICFKKLLPSVSAVFCISEVARGWSFMDPVPWSVILMRGLYFQHTGTGFHMGKRFYP